MFVVYHKQTTQIVGKDLRPDHRKTYKSHAAALAAITRAAKKAGIWETDPNHPKYVYGVARKEGFHQTIEKTVIKTNMMTGEQYRESVNTPLHMSPSSETYWSM